MAQNVNPTFVKTPNFGGVIISTGTAGNVTVYAGGANGSKIPGLVAASVNTTAAFDIRVQVSSGGGTPYWLGTVSVPANAGLLATVPAVNVFNLAQMPGLTLDSDGNPYIILASSAYLLQVNVNASSSLWAAGAAIHVVAPSVGDF